MLTIKIINEMKQFKNILSSDKKNKDEVVKKVSYSFAHAALKSLLIAFILFWITLLTSCAVFVRGPYDGHDHHDHYEHHDEPGDEDHG
jgi:hypothetical protein